jgi:hypothetical protein
LRRHPKQLASLWVAAARQYIRKPRHAQQEEEAAEQEWHDTQAWPRIRGAATHMNMLDCESAVFVRSERSYDRAGVCSAILEPWRHSAMSDSTRGVDGDFPLTSIAVADVDIMLPSERICQSLFAPL